MLGTKKQHLLQWYYQNCGCKVNKLGWTFSLAQNIPQAPDIIHHLLKLRGNACREGGLYSKYIYGGCNGAFMI